MIDTLNGYWFTFADLPRLQVANYYPEKTSNESGVIRDYLVAHGAEFDQFGFNVRVGQSVPPDSTHLIGVQKSTVYSSRKRIDLVGVKGDTVTLIEAKGRIQPAALGQVLTYRKLWMEDNAADVAPRLVVIGRYSDEDTVNALVAHGIDVLIFEVSI